MVIDKSTFLVLVGALSAGVGGGYLAAKQEESARPAPVPPPPPSPPATVIASLPPPPVATVPTAVSPPCDDREGTVGTCPPPMYSADETGCGALPTKRCTDFKEVMKPKVAERAVACLNSLKPGERCDPNRINLCGHVALMSACVEPAAGASAHDDEVGLSCQKIVDSCSGAATTPTLRDCRATLAGMSESGRTHAVDCMKKHCSDKGLLGCEARIDPAG
ncbi:MAG: hypothetical protein ACLP1X_23500 [Polyangiaceae bacterium]